MEVLSKMKTKMIKMKIIIMNTSKIVAIFSLSLSFLLSLFFLSCSKDGTVSIFNSGNKDKNPKLSEYEKGLRYLESGNYSDAYSTFENLVKKEGEKPEYLLGMALASVASEFSKLPEKVQRGLQMFSPKFNPDLEKIDTKQEQKLPGLNAILETFAKDLILDMIETNLPTLIKVSEKIDENFVFPITFLPVNFPGTPFGFFGNWGYAEVNFLAGLGAYLAFLIRFILSVNINAPISSYFAVNEFVKSKGGWGIFFADPLNVGFRAIAHLLNSSNSIFTLWSKENLLKAKEYGLISVEYDKKTYESLLLNYKKRNRRENFVAFFDEEFKRIHMKVYVGGEVKILDFTSTQDYETIIRSDQEVIDHFRGKNKEPIRCSAFYDRLGDVVGFFVSSGFVLSAAQSSIKSGRGESIAKFFEGTKNLLGIFLILTSICMADVVEIDINKLVDNFQGLRNLFPVWTFTSSQFDDSIWLEWECGTNSLKPDFSVLDPAGAYLQCSKRATLKDSNHFSDQIVLGAGITQVAGVKVTRLSEPRCEQTFEECIKLYGGINPLQEGIPRDGQYSRVPYFLFQDPSFYGSLWINPQRIGVSFCGAPMERHMPEGITGVCELNALIWYFYSQLF
jgi:tetratricopeptide (TPR) repeat protein